MNSYKRRMGVIHHTPLGTIAQIPFTADSSFSKEDDKSPGELAPKTRLIQMKALWLANPRVHQYLQHSLDYRLVATCQDNPNDLWLELYAAAYFGAEISAMSSFWRRSNGRSLRCTRGICLACTRAEFTSVVHALLGCTRGLLGCARGLLG